MDNVYLNFEIKSKPNEADVIMEQYKIGMVLIGMSIIHSNKKQSENGNSSNKEENIPVDENVNMITKAIAPVLLPMINNLAELNLTDDDE